MISYIRGVQKEKEEDKLNLKELKENDHYDNIEEVTLEGNYNDMTLLEGWTPDAKQLKELQEMFDHSSKKWSKRRGLNNGKRSKWNSTWWNWT